MLNLNTCPHCGAIHVGMCSRIKSIEYYPDGLIKKVEYHDGISTPVANPVPNPFVWPQPMTPAIPATPPWKPTISPWTTGGINVVTPHENVQVII